MLVWVIIGLYQGLVDRVGVYDTEEKAKSAIIDMKSEGLEVSGPHSDEVS